MEEEARMDPPSDSEPSIQVSLEVMPMQLNPLDQYKQYVRSVVHDIKQSLLQVQRQNP